MERSLQAALDSQVYTVIDIQVVPGQAGGGSFQKNKPIGSGRLIRRAAMFFDKTSWNQLGAKAKQPPSTVSQDKTLFMHFCKIQNRDDSAAY